MPAKKDELQALMETYRINREELRGFRDTIFKTVSIVITALTALLAGMVQFGEYRLVLLVPIPATVLVLAGLAYRDWRWELIQVTAKIEERIGKVTGDQFFPEDCRYECTFVKSHPKGEFGGMGRSSFKITLVLLVLALVAFYLVALRWLQLL